MSVTTAEAALLLRVSARRVRALCKQGRIPGARRRYGNWRVPARAGAITITPAEHGPPLRNKEAHPLARRFYMEGALP